MEVVELGTLDTRFDWMRDVGVPDGDVAFLAYVTVCNEVGDPQVDRRISDINDLAYQGLEATIIPVQHARN